MRKKVLFVMLLIIGLFIITGCKSAMEKAAGTYKLEYSKYVGDPDTAKSKDVASIELKSDGTGKSYRDNNSYDLKWSIDDENITITEKYNKKTIEYNGTLVGDKLDLFNGDKKDALTNETVYIKES